MTLGKRKDERQPDLFVSHDRLPRGPGHVFYRKLNQLLAEAGFDRWVEKRCEPHYAREGRPSLPPGVAYKAEHVVDLETEIIVTSEIYPGAAHDGATLEDSVNQAQTNERETGREAFIQDVAADAGYRTNEAVTDFREATPYRTYIPEPKSRHKRVWTDKPPEQQAAVQANRRRTRGDRGKPLQRWRSERVERSFAHVCETDGARRSWLTGIGNVRKRYLIAAAAYNLGVVMRKLFGMGTPRSLQGFGRGPGAIFCALWAILTRIVGALSVRRAFSRLVRHDPIAFGQC